MDRIRVGRFGIAFGTALAALHGVCVLGMSMVGKETAVFLANSLIHGSDFTTIIRMHVPPIEIVVGLVGNFVLGWLAGTIIALIYNVGLRSQQGA